MNTQIEKEYSVWDYINDIQNQKSGKMELSKVHEVHNRKHLVDKKIKNNKERINIPNATIRYYNYRYEQDSEIIQSKDESEALRTNESNKKGQRSGIRANQETNEQQDLIITDKDDEYQIYI